MSGKAEKIVISADSTVVAINRGSSGMAIVNLSEQPAEISLATTLKNGEYTDKVHNNTFTVKNGKVTAKLDPETSYVIY